MTGTRRIPRRGQTRSPGSHAFPSGGFTLIEVVASLVIFAAGVLVATELSTRLSQLVRDAGIRSQAIVLAQARLDSLQTVPFATLGEGLVEETTELQGRSYRVLMSVVPDGFRLVTLDVTVTPSEPPGPEHRVTSFRAAPW